VIIYVDIDDTICTTLGTNYQTAVPIKEAIDKVNLLYEAGNIIVYWTARGTVTGIDWRDLTEKQLLSWGAKYTELKMGKPAYDVFIDDKNINSKDWLEGKTEY
jgi:dTDP-glucose 4,6-dehydratase